MSHFELLKSCSIFSKLNDSEMILLEKSCEEILLSKGETLFESGDASKGFCLIKAGKLYVGDQEDSENVLKAGDFIGPFSLFKNGLKAKLTVKALETTAILNVSPQSFIQLTKENATIKLKVAYSVLSEYISELDTVVDVLKNNTPD